MQSFKDMVLGQEYTRAELKGKFDIADASINNRSFHAKGNIAAAITPRHAGSETLPKAPLEAVARTKHPKIAKPPMRQG